MISNRLRFQVGVPFTVGSFGDADALRGAGSGPVLNSCDVAEIRLDLLAMEDVEPDRRLWAHLDGVPLLFTARRKEEGGALESTTAQRLAWLETTFDDAAAIDIEVASLAENAVLLEILQERGIPIVASFHDFEGTPDEGTLARHLETARTAGATVFKAAAKISTPDDIALLANFQRTDHGMPKSLMGMGPLAPVSRLLCAQLGSVLNYGYLGKNPTAPGQWSAARLKDAISALNPVGS